MAAAGLALGLAGCGDDGPSREEWAAQADGVCGPALVQLRAVYKRIDAAASGAEPDAVFAESAALLREGVAISRAAFVRIEALDAPGEGADAIDAWVAANRREAALTVQLSAAYNAQDETRIARLSEQVDALDERNTATAGGLGLRRCAERVRT